MMISGGAELCPKSDKLNVLSAKALNATLHDDGLMGSIGRHDQHLPESMRAILESLV